MAMHFYEANMKVCRMKLRQDFKSQISHRTDVDVADVELDWCKKIRKLQRNKNVCEEQRW